MNEQRTFTCDGCGKTHTGEMKPWDWYVRMDDDGEQFACSRKCIETTAEKTGKTRVVLPW